MASAVPDAGMAVDEKASRWLNALSAEQISSRLTPASILVLPLGATEQHGAHLPLDTDTVIAEELTARIFARWAETYDLWRLPSIRIGLSREHDWAAGTLSLSIQEFTTLLRDMARDLVKAVPARNLAMLNCHGGNRGLLGVLIHELRGDFGLNACVIHPFDLSKAEAGGADVHGGRSETSVMLALAPQRVKRELIAAEAAAVDAQAIRAFILERGTSWPWRTDDPRLAQGGVIGDPRAASFELGEAIVASIVEEAGPVFARLLENQKFMPTPRA